MNTVLDEINENKRESQRQLEIIEKQLEALWRKQGKLYHSFETGKLDVDDLAPRIKELKTLTRWKQNGIKLLKKYRLRAVCRLTQKTQRLRSRPC